MKIYKTREVKTPTRGTEKSAGIDFYIPELNGDFLMDFLNKNDISIDIDSKTFRVGPNERVLIPSGIKVNIPKGYTLIAFNKSGISSKYGLDVMACVVDEDYQGEIHLSLVNTSDDYIDLQCGMKIVQFLLIPINYCNIELIEDEDTLYKTNTERGENGFGSTSIF